MNNEISLRWSEAKTCKAVIFSHQGVIENGISFSLNGVNHYVKNVPEAWNFFKAIVILGGSVTCERTLWDGEKEVFDWVGSPSYTHRFGKQ